MLGLPSIIRWFSAGELKSSFDGHPVRLGSTVTVTVLLKFEMWIFGNDFGSSSVRFQSINGQNIFWWFDLFHAELQKQEIGKSKSNQMPKAHLSQSDKLAHLWLENRLRKLTERSNNFLQSIYFANAVEIEIESFEEWKANLDRVEKLEIR